MAKLAEARYTISTTIFLVGRCVELIVDVVSYS